MTAPGPAIDVTGLVKSYGGRVVVDHVSMTVEQGEIAGFLGPNGSGKTTTIRLMCGLLTPEAGSGTVLGHDLLKDAGRIKREVGYMTQRFSLYEDLTIAENLRLVAGLYGLQPKRQIVADTLSDLGLSSRKNQLAGTLSGGWKQRLALAASIMHKPKLLLLDEPTAGVDPKARREFWHEIHELSAQGLTVLVSTHYVDEAERCHRVNYISYGKLLVSGTIAEVAKSAGLTTYMVEGGDMVEFSRLVQDLPGVTQIAPFGTSLHVVGADADLLKASVTKIARKTGARASVTETSLEDAFISFMDAAEDNMT